MDCDSMSSSSDGIDIEVAEELIEHTLCLFCDNHFHNTDSLFQHCADVHQFDIKEQLLNHKMDCYGYIRMINFIRDQLVFPQWVDDCFMKPVIQDDPLLSYDVDSILEMMEQSVSENCNGIDKCSSYVDELQHKLAETTKSLAEMRSFASSVLTEPIGDSSINDKDDYYVSGYSHFAIHEEMLQDEIRTGAYQSFILNNRDFFNGSSVLDVGCGTAILSMFAAQAGASRVYAIEMSDIAYQAMDIVRENQLEDKITVVKQRLEDVETDHKEATVRMSMLLCLAQSTYWLATVRGPSRYRHGMAAVNGHIVGRSMLETIITARDRYLKPGGHIFPNRCRMCLCASADEQLHSKHVLYWQNVFGFKMSCMRSQVMREPGVVVVPFDTIATDYCQVKEFDIQTCTLDDLTVDESFEMSCFRDCELTALVGYFNAYFDSPDQDESKSVWFSTGPQCPPTHWKQTVMLIEKISVKKGDCLNGRLKVRKNPKDPRGLLITVNIADRQYLYVMS